MQYQASPKRYDTMPYNRVGRSGLLLPAISLGLWHNFGGNTSFEQCRDMLCGAFDLGITHFDLANNYGPPIGSAESHFGEVMRRDLQPHRDELVLSTKAGFRMWEGPYGEWGSKKYLIASLDQSLARMGVEYVDIFYSHRPDPHTPLEETCEALAQIVKSGKALYVGVSNYDAETTAKAHDLLYERGIHLLIHQPNYSMMSRGAEQGLFQTLREKGMGAIAYSPLAQGLLTNRYFHGIPADSRAGGDSIFLDENRITPALIDKARRLDALAQQRGQTLSQMALSWVLRVQPMASVIIGASRLSQIQENVGAIEHLTFTEEELRRIDEILA